MGDQPLGADPTAEPYQAFQAFMERALVCAARAAAEGEVPVGAVVVRGGEILGEAWNRSEQLGDPTGHAEILALRRAAALARNWRLPDTMLVTTLEPCLMCFGALLEARVATLVFGASDPVRGATYLWKSGQLSRYPVRSLALVEGVARDRCATLLKEWFAVRRDASRPDE